MCAKRHIVYSSVCWWPLTPYEYFLFIALEKTDYKVLHKVVFHLLLERTKTHTTPRWVPVNHRKPRPNGPLLYGLFDSHLLNAHHAALKRSLLRLSSLLPGNSWQHPAGKQLDKQPEPFSLFQQNQTVRKTKVFLLCRSRAVSMWNVLVSTQALRGVQTLQSDTRDATWRKRNILCFILSFSWKRLLCEQDSEWASRRVHNVSRVTPAIRGNRTPSRRSSTPLLKPAGAGRRKGRPINMTATFWCCLPELSICGLHMSKGATLDGRPGEAGLPQLGRSKVKGSGGGDRRSVWVFE